MLALFDCTLKIPINVSLTGFFTRVEKKRTSGYVLMSSLDDTTKTPKMDNAVE